MKHIKKLNNKLQTITDTLILKEYYDFRVGRYCIYSVHYLWFVKSLFTES